MKLAALFSGGKDSTLAAKIVEETGHQLKYLVTIRSSNPDSYMFHTANIDVTELQAESWGIEHVITDTSGVKEKELNDLRDVLSTLDVDGVVTGAIASNYQKVRVDRLCSELNLKHHSPLWGFERSRVLNEIISRDMEVVFTAVAAQGLDKEWLGRRLEKGSIDELLRLNKLYGVDPCGEGGEYETIVLDAPWFREALVYDKAEKIWDGLSGRLLIRDARLTKK